MKKALFTGFIVLVLFFTPSPTVHANSSWQWLTMRPCDVLPLAIATAILIETVAVIKFAGVTAKWKALMTVLAANVASHLLPYLVRMIACWRKFDCLCKALNAPYYTVGIYYLLITALAELPALYLILGRLVEDTRRLAWTIVLANISSTLVTGGVEHWLCQGQW